MALSTARHGKESWVRVMSLRRWARRPSLVARHDFELDAPVERVECVVAAAAHDVLPKAHAGCTRARAERDDLGHEALADDAGALERELIVHRRGAAVARVSDH